MHAKRAIRASLSDRPDLVELFDRDAPDPSPAPPFRIKRRLGFAGDSLTIDTARFDVLGQQFAQLLREDGFEAAGAGGEEFQSHFGPTPANRCAHRGA